MNLYDLSFANHKKKHDFQFQSRKKNDKHKLRMIKSHHLKII